MRAPRVRVALLVREGGRILLVRQQKGGRSYWLLPGGGLNYGEKLSDAIERELTEELGLRVTRIGRLIWCSDTLAPDQSRHLVNLCFEGEVEGDPVPGEDTIISADYFSAEQITDMDIHPPLHRQLIDYLAGDERAGIYLGDLWQD